MIARWRLIPHVWTRWSTAPRSFRRQRYEDAAAVDRAPRDPDYPYLRGFLFFFRLNCCDWNAYEQQRALC